MALDNLEQLGRHFGRTSRQIGHTTRDISRNLPLVEETADIFGTINPFQFEFKTYTGHNVLLNLVIKQRFIVL